jgi:hypothetical protein
MKSKYLPILLLLLALVLPIQGQKPSAPQSDQGRYQLLPVALGERGGTPQLFLFDSQTGRVWHYRPESYAGNGPSTTFAPEAFIPVSVWSPGPKDKVSPDGN